MAREEHLRELEEKYENYTVYDNRGSKIGKVDDLFVDDADHEEYIGVKTGLFGLKSTLIPTEIVRINEQDRTIEVAESKDRVKDAPNFDDDEDITAEYEERIRSHFGLESLESSGRGSYNASAGATGASTAAGTGASTGASAHNDTAEEHDERHASPESGSSDREAHDEDAGTSDAGQTGATSGHHDAGTSGALGRESSVEGEGSTAGQQPNVRQTEETETFQEGGRTKVRRRIVREEIIDTDER